MTEDKPTDEQIESEIEGMLDGEIFSSVNHQRAAHHALQEREDALAKVMKSLERLHVSTHDVEEALLQTKSARQDLGRVLYPPTQPAPTPIEREISRSEGKPIPEFASEAAQNLALQSEHELHLFDRFAPGSGKGGKLTSRDTERAITSLDSELSDAALASAAKEESGVR